MKALLLALALVLLVHPARAEECTSGRCVEEEDLRTFMKLLAERSCLDTQKPEFELDPIEIVVDRDGRVFFSGGDPRPYKLRMKWCHYEVETEGKLKVIAAVQEPPTVGFRFRPKAYAGVLLLEPFREGKEFSDAIDAGLMLDTFYWHDFNINFHAGFRAVGAGVGVDIFRSFGGYVGYALAWDGFHHNPEASLWFAFW